MLYGLKLWSRFNSVYGSLNLISTLNVSVAIQLKHPRFTQEYILRQGIEKDYSYSYPLNVNALFNSDVMVAIHEILIPI